MFRCSNTWLAGEPCKGCSDGANKYAYHQSPTFIRGKHAVAVQYATGAIAGITGNEVLTLLPAAMSKFPNFQSRLDIGIVLIANDPLFRQINFEGVLGLGRIGGLDEGMQSVWAAKCPEALISLTLPAGIDEEGILEVQPATNVDSSWFPVSDDRKWALPIDEVRWQQSVIWKKASNREGKLHFDSGSSVNTMPEPVEHSLVAILSKFCQERSDKPIDQLVFTLSNGAEVDVPVEQYYNMKSCRSKVFATPTTSGQPYYFNLGVPFFQKHKIHMMEIANHGYIKFTDR